MNRHNGNAIVYGIVAVVIASLGSATAVYIFAPQGTDVAPLIGLVGPTVAALATLGGVRQLTGKVEQVDKRTTDLTNGLADAKMRAAVADVVHPDAINPDALEQLKADRVRRDTYHATGA